MRKIILFSILMLLVCNLIAFAGPFSDVPQGHWAFDAINSLTEKGILKGYEDGTFGGNKVVSRYHLAVVISRMLASIEQKPETVSRADLKVVERLTMEFADELSLMNISVKSLEKELYGIKKDVSNLKTDVKNLKDFIKNGGNDKVKISGDVLVRNFGSEGYNRNNNNRAEHNHRTESIFRIHLDTKISDKISAHASWNLIEDVNNNPGVRNPNEWDGRNKNTGSVERAYLKLKNVLNSNETIKIGRDWYSHGHGLVVHDFMDAISFSKPVKNANLAFNFFYDRNNSLNQKDYLNIWNINIDYYYKNQKLYLGFYYNSRDWAYNIVNNRISNPQERLDKKGKDIRVEMGASGNIGKKSNGLTYDLASVYNRSESYAKYPNDRRKIDLKGWLTYAAVKYDKNKDFNFKLAYTYADEDSLANIKRNDFNSQFMRKETPFDDLSLLISNGFLNNIKNYKAQVGFRLKNANKHNFRFAFDKIQEDNSNLIKTDTNLITAEYRYQISPNTRIRFIYQNAKDKEGFYTPTNKDVKLYMTEIYTRF
ncbi:MAG: S-layer homology domain-containing protein [Candidatus Riflebacteria bacterium]|nr:S-layer homology domain-containing protein [Candidatus Riflebacteria bacterium]MBR4569258.1 S-layer homology domain-containing protein [Candidatus Riflebacteria bacterium]